MVYRASLTPAVMPPVLDLLLAGHGLNGLPVHRLDRPVSGCLLVALDREERPVTRHRSRSGRSARPTGPWWKVKRWRRPGCRTPFIRMPADIVPVAKGGGQQLHYLRLAQGTGSRCWRSSSSEVPSIRCVHNSQHPGCRSAGM